MHSILQDIRYGIRSLRKNPGFAVVAILTFAIGIGANTSFFSIVNAVLLRPLPYSDSERLVFLNETWKESSGGSVSAGNWHDWREQSKSFEQIAAMQGSSFNLQNSEIPERVAGTRVTADFFRVFDVKPVLGGTFTADDDQPGKEQAVVLGEQLWRSRFQSDPSIIGKNVQLDGKPYSVRGVMPGHFDPINSGTQLWVPIAFSPERLKIHDEHYLVVVGRLKPGISLRQAQSEMDIIAKRQRENFPKDDQGRGIRLWSFADSMVRDYRDVLWMLLVSVGFVLLIACANIANLQLTRARKRQKEIAVRAALGASPWRIVRQLLTESIVLSIIGGAAGLLLAYLGTTWLIAHSPAGVPRLNESALDLRTLGFTVVVTVFAGLFCGLAPALRSRSANLSEEVKTGSVTNSSGDWTRSAIVVSEIALALMLLVGAGLFIRSAMLLQQVNPGFDPTNVLAARVTLPTTQYKDATVIKQTFARMLEQAKAMPGVQSAALDSRVPLSGANTNGLIPEGKPFEADSAINSRFQLVSPGYFSTMRIPLKSGRGFGTQDSATAPKAMIINESLAKAAWPNQNAIGKRFACCEDGPGGGPVWHEVVGVVADVHAFGLDANTAPEFYLPIEQAPDDSWDWLQRSMDVLIRTSSDPMSVTNPLRRAVLEVAPGVPIYSVSTLETLIATSTEQSRFNTMLFAVFAIAALLLASIGIYGVLSYSVAQRTHEIGIRMALGATHGNVLRLIMGQAMRMVALGTVIGLIGAFAASRLIASMLFSVHPTDPTTFISVAALLVAVALLASFIPARRALKVDPMVALRLE